MFIRLLCIGSSCFLLLLPAANAEQAIVDIPADFQTRGLASEVDVLEDPAQALTVAQVAGRDFEKAFLPQRGSANLGYTGSAYWLRIKLRQPAPIDRTVLLEVEYPHLDHVSVFLPATGAEGFVEKRTGDSTVFSTRDINHRHFVFKVPLDGTDVRTIYVRIASGGTVTYPVRLWSPEAFHDAHTLELLILGIFYGMLVAMAFYNLFLYLTVRDRVYLYYVAFIASVGMLMFSLDGLGYQFIWTGLPAIVNWTNSTLTCLTLIFVQLFAHEFLSLPKTSPRMGRLIRGLIYLMPAAFALTAFGGYSVAMRTMLQLGLISLVVVVSCAVMSWRAGYRPARFFFIAFGIEIPAAGMLMLSSIGMLPTNFLTVHGLQIGIGIDVLLLSIALADRINALKRDKELAQAEALASQQRALADLKKHEEALEKRVEERTNELHFLANTLRDEIRKKEAIEVQLRENEQQMRHLAHHDALTGLPNRMSLQERLTMAIQQAQRNGTSVALLMIDLDNFKQINDSWGHSAGDAVLCTVARRLQAMVRNVDTVARIGGDEFVVVLSDVDSDADALLVAEKILTALSEPVSAFGATYQTSPSIGISLFPRDGTNLDELLKRADTAAYQAKKAGKNTFRLAMS
ncbi:diguanylate cyclase domain-containing protein [Noviherbaspirillum sp.]|uniref:diguanylate cyclase domain-containing protein n=1 Tax=Noviherbaspirillum sp. TaxID=1926288 RepID=UPI002FE0669E